MASPTLVAKREAAAAKFKEANDFLQSSGVTDYAEAPDEVKQTFDRILNDALTLDGDFKKAAEGEEKTGTLQERLSYYHEVATGKGIGWQPVEGYKKSERPKSWGEEFVEHEAYQELVKSGVLNSDNQKFKMSGVQLKAATDILTTLAGQGSADGLVMPAYLPGILGLPQRPMTVREMFGQGRTSGDLVSYAAQVSFESAANAVRQAIAVDGSGVTGGVKPQSSISWERRTAPVETIATWMAVTRQTLADAGQVQALIDNQGRLMIQIEEEDQLLSGNGVSPNIQGLIGTSGVQTLDLSGVDNLDGIRQAIAMVKLGLSRLNADSIVLHPQDSMSVDLLTDQNGMYRGGNPIGNFDFGQTIWRLRRVESEGVTEGTAIVGNFRAGATVLERQGITVYTTDSHSDFFVRNLVVILFEERLAFPVFFPSAFVVVTLADWETSGGVEDVVS